LAEDERFQRSVQVISANIHISEAEAVAATTRSPI
jgi:hypothetical protein